MIDKIGEDGVSTVEESFNHETTIEMQKGFQIENGWRLPHFITDPVEETAVLEGARVLVTDQVLSDFTELSTFLAKELLPHGRTLFVIAQDFEGNVLPSFVMNKMNGKLNVLCVQAPLFKNIQKNLLHDIAILTGATMIGEDTGIKLKDIKFEHLGYAKTIKATKDATIITGGKGKKEEINNRIKAIRKQIEEEDSSFETAKLQERLAKLTGAVAVIKVGGATQVEMRERKERVKDAVEATKTAVRDGIVPGGEITFIHVASQLKHSKEFQLKIVRNAFLSPFKKLLSNAGLDTGRFLQKLEGAKPEMGIDVTTGKVVDLLKEGIIDPAGVLTSAIYNAFSVAIQAITSEVIVPFIEEDKNKK